MGNERITTKDGSHTLYVPELDETYHSRHGAIQESMHVFIQAGLLHVAHEKNEIRILELGFGTGLNTWLTALELPENTSAHYTTVEKYPVSIADALSLNYPAQMGAIDGIETFERITECNWDESISISDKFTLFKIEGDFLEADFGAEYDLVYWDVFGFRAQSHLWESPLFEKVYASMAQGGCLVTYCSKGVVRRTMQAVGFEVEKLQGPPGKREMVRAWKK